MDIRSVVFDLIEGDVALRALGVTQGCCGRHGQAPGRRMPGSCFIVMEWAADDNPSAPQARFVASAFVALGHYHLEGIPETRVKPDATRARQMYAYAASYFGDADAQYHLGRMYLEGTGVPKDPRQAGRWLGASAGTTACC